MVKAQDQSPMYTLRFDKISVMLWFLIAFSRAESQNRKPNLLVPRLSFSN